MHDISFAIVVATYNRSNGMSPFNIRRMFSNLRAQTYTNFKVFLIGDDYQPAEEFENLCQEFESERLYCKNYVGTSFRGNVFKLPHNRWANGGIYASYHGLKQAISEGFKYYLHLDDDDIWESTHIQEHYNTLIKFPLVDYMYTISNFCKIHLPRNTLGTKLDLFYNNRKVIPADVVHSTWCINLQTVGPLLLELLEERLALIDKIKAGTATETKLMPMDKSTIFMINSQQKLYTIFIPKLTCTKETNINIP